MFVEINWLLWRGLTGNRSSGNLKCTFMKFRFHFVFRKLFVYFVIGATSPFIVRRKSNFLIKTSKGYRVVTLGY